MRLNVPSFIGIAGFCSLFLGLLCAGLIFPKLENYLIEKATALEEGSTTFESWKKIPFPFKFKIYFLNVTNPDEVQIGAKPVLKEMGPYIYDEFREREVLSVDEENDTITYFQRKFFSFNEQESGCRSEDDVVTIVHFALLSMADKINKISPMALPMLNDALPFLYPNIKNVFITNSVRNILFDGLTLMCDSEEVEIICDGVKSKLPHTMRIAENGRDLLLSLFNNLNGTDDGPYEIGRGLKNTIKGNVVAFKDSGFLAQWNAQCNEIRGTDLTINPRFLEIPETIDFFVPDFCRYFSVDFDKEMDFEGLHTLHFNTSNLFQEKKCFCGKKSEDDESLQCPPWGTMDLGPCSGSPIIISQPHFLNTEKSVNSFVRGLTPNLDKHNTFVIMEPKTGLALKVRTRFQMSIFIKKYDEIDVLKNVSEGFFPFLWLENAADVPQTIIEEVRSNFDKLKIFDVLKYVFIGLGVVLLVVSLILAMVKDKIICFCNRQNVISVRRNEQFGRFSDVSSELKMSNGSVQFQDYLGRYAWKIEE